MKRLLFVIAFLVLLALPAHGQGIGIGVQGSVPRCTHTALNAGTCQTEIGGYRATLVDGLTADPDRCAPAGSGGSTDEVACIYNGESGAWEELKNGLAGGSTSFLSLTDVDPATYLGQTGKVVKVNPGETGLEFGIGGNFTPNADPGVDHSSFDTEVTNNTTVAANAAHVATPGHDGNASTICVAANTVLDAEGDCVSPGDSFTPNVDPGVDHSSFDTEVTNNTTVAANAAHVATPGHDGNASTICVAANTVLDAEGDCVSPGGVEVNDLETTPPAAILDDEVMVGGATPGTASLVPLQNCNDGTHSLDWNGTAWVCNLITGGSASNSFETQITPSGDASVVADGATDTLTWAEGNGITISGTQATDTITIASTVSNPLDERTAAANVDMGAFDITLDALSTVDGRDVGVDGAALDLLDGEWDTIVDITDRTTMCEDFATAVEPWLTNTATSNTRILVVGGPAPGTPWRVSTDGYDDSGNWPYSSCFALHPQTTIASQTPFPDSLGRLTDGIADTNIPQGSSDYRLHITWAPSTIFVDQTGMTKNGTLLDIGNGYMAGGNGAGDPQGRMDGMLSMSGRIEVKILTQNVSGYTGVGTVGDGIPEGDSTDRFNADSSTSFAPFSFHGANYTDLSALNVGWETLDADDIGLVMTDSWGGSGPTIASRNGGAGVGAQFFGFINRTLPLVNLRQQDFGIVLGGGEVTDADVHYYSSCDSADCLDETRGARGVHIDGGVVEGHAEALLVDIDGDQRSRFTNIHFECGSACARGGILVKPNICDGTGTTPRAAGSPVGSMTLAGEATYCAASGGNANSPSVEGGADVLMLSGLFPSSAVDDVPNILLGPQFVTGSGYQLVLGDGSDMGQMTLGSASPFSYAPFAFSDAENCPTCGSVYMGASSDTALAGAYPTTTYPNAAVVMDVAANTTYVGAHNTSFGDHAATAISCTDPPGFLNCGGDLQTGFDNVDVLFTLFEAAQAQNTTHRVTPNHTIDQSAPTDCSGFPNTVLDAEGDCVSPGNASTTAGAAVTYVTDAQDDFGIGWDGDGELFSDFSIHLDEASSTITAQIITATLYGRNTPGISSWSTTDGDVLITAGGVDKDVEITGDLWNVASGVVTAASFAGVGSALTGITDLEIGAVDALNELGAMTCTATQILEYNGSAWACIPTPGGGGDDVQVQNLTFGNGSATVVHTYDTDTTDPTLTVTNDGTFTINDDVVVQSLTVDPSATPGVTWIDSDTDGELSAEIAVNCEDPVAATEDCDMVFKARRAGEVTTTEVFRIDTTAGGDQAVVFAQPPQIFSWTGTPALAVDGEIAIDNTGDPTTVAQPIINYYGGTTGMYAFGLDAFPTADNQIIKYNAGLNKLEWDTDGGGVPGVDSVGVSELDDLTNPAPNVGDWVQVDGADNTAFDYRTDAEARVDLGLDTLSNLNTSIGSSIADGAHTPDQVGTVTDGSYCQGGLGSILDCDVASIPAADIGNGLTDDQVLNNITIDLATTANNLGANAIDNLADFGAIATCGANTILERNAGDTAWTCISTPSGGGSSNVSVNGGANITAADFDTNSDLVWSGAENSITATVVDNSHNHVVTNIATTDELGLETLAGGINIIEAGDINESLELINIVGDETGEGALVFGTSPTLTTPVIGAATGTSLALTGALSGDVLVVEDTAANIGVMADDSEMKGHAYYVTTVGTITLPAITADGWSACFYMLGTGAMIIDVNAADQMRLEGTLNATPGAGISITAAAGDYVCLISRENAAADEWMTMGINGTWAAQ